VTPFTSLSNPRLIHQTPKKKARLRYGHPTVPAPSPFIIGFFDAYVCPIEDKICLVLEYMAGGSLQAVINRAYGGDDGMTGATDVQADAGAATREGAHVTEAAVAVVAYSVLRALVVLHGKKIVHNDVKVIFLCVQPPFCWCDLFVAPTLVAAAPLRCFVSVSPRLSVVQPSNILIGADGQVKLSDFGLIKEEKDGTYHSVCSTFKGTYAFMSPERLAGQQYSSPSDVWSLGVSLFMLLTGTSPFAKAKG